jgi:polyisoprenoid-binding protein YceI
MKTKAIVLPVLLIAAMAFSFITNYKLDAEHSKVAFSIKGPMGKVEGTFGGLKTEIQFDENNLVGSSIFASVEVNSIETGVALRNKDLREKPEWFEAEKYPQITIKSKKIEKVGSGFQLTGELTMKGVTKPVVMPFSFTPVGNGGLFMSKFTINREDFGLGKPGGPVGDEVSISLEVPVLK